MAELCQQLMLRRLGYILTIGTGSHPTPRGLAAGFLRR